jgi:hypothetical protein
MTTEITNSPQAEIARLRRINAELLKACRAADRWYRDEKGQTGDVFGPNGIIATAIAKAEK